MTNLRYLLPLLGAAAVVLAAAPGAIRQRNAGAYLLSQGKAEEAIPLLENAAGIDPNYTQAHADLCVAYFQIKRFADAVKACEIAVRLDPDRRTGHLNLAATYEELERWPEAVEIYTRLLERQPDDTAAREHLERVKLVMERSKKTEKK